MKPTPLEINFTECLSFFTAMKSPRYSALWSVAVFCLASLPPLFAAERVALVIGNNAYKHGTPLKNCVNDAKAVADALKKTGFQVIIAEDASLEQMEAKALEFKRAAVGAKAAWFHYSGHGAEVEGVNYLIPVDANVKDKFQVKHQTFAVDQILGAMEDAETPLKVLVLDCCRDNPFGRGWSRSGSAGLAQIGAPSGTFIAFATSPGKVAADGDGANSPFTAALVRAITTPGLDVKDVFDETCRQVIQSTNNEQLPWISKSYYNPFVMMNIVNGNGGGGVSSVVPRETAPAPSNMPEQMPARFNEPAPTPASLMPADMPVSGFFDSAQVFEGTAYAKFNMASRRKILERAQEKLRKLQFYGGAVDGNMGQGSQKAILEWQESQGLPRTGKIDLATQSGLGLTGHEEVEAPPAANSKTPSKPRSRKDSAEGKSSPKPARPAAQDLDEQFRRAAQEFESR